MNASENISSQFDDRVDLVAMVRVIWRRKYLVAAFALIGAIVATVLALTAIPIFRAETVVSEVRDRGMGGGLMGQFSGLASLAGINLPSGVGSESQAVLKSRHLIEEFIQRNGMLSELVAGTKGKPTLWAAVKRFKESMVSIHEDKNNGLTTISIDGTDPIVTAQRTNAFVVLANELVRDRALNNAKQNIAYLNEKVGGTTDVELRKVLYDLIESETKTLMLANARKEYAFTVVDPAVPPEIRTSPKRTLMVVLGTVLGFLVGVIVALVINTIVRYRALAAGVK